MSVSTKQARLIAAIRDAQEDQGVTGTELSRRAGTSQSVISQALGGKANMNEEKWRMCCEALGLDYDDIVAGLAPQTATPDPEPAAEVQQTDPVRCGVAALEEKTCDPLGDSPLVARYLTGKLREDITRGTEMSLEDLYTLLRAVRVLSEEERTCAR